jgi:hypothetical protein
MTRSRDLADTQDNLGGAVAPYVGAKNAVINGAFDFWQRGTSVSGYTYTSDRWLAYNAAAVNTISRQSTSLNGFQYCARVQRNSGSTNTGATYLVQPVESSNSYQFQNKTTTLSFYARAGANFSASGSAINANIETSTGTDQSYIAAWAGSVSITSSKTLTTSWQLFTVTGLVPSTANQVAVNFNYTPVGTAGAADYFEVTGVQLELGAVATPFARAGGSIGGELALCQRYFTSSFPNGVAPGNKSGPVVANGNDLSNYSTTVGNAYATFKPFEVSMRVAPSVSIFNMEGIGTATWSLYNATTKFADSGASAIDANTRGFSIYFSGSTITVSNGGWSANAEL